MHTVDQIRHLHLELSSFCNARCPQCPRNYAGYPYNAGYEEKNLPLELIKRVFTPKIINQFYKGVLFCGNLGDPSANLETADIVRYFYESAPNVRMFMDTNGSARGLDFWRDLGKTSVEVYFALDGLEDTHHLYRQDTNWRRILENATAFMSSGIGKATWKMILFDHNRHQVDDCRNLAKQLGFHDFILVDAGRNTGPVFDRQGNHTHSLGEFTGKMTIESLIARKKPKYVDVPMAPHIKPNCYSVNEKSIYVSAEGRVYPCCFIGFSPQTFMHGGTGVFNQQIKLIEKRNNLWEDDLDICMEWFNSVEESWDKQSYKEGRLMACESFCGACSGKKVNNRVEDSINNTGDSAIA